MIEKLYKIIYFYKRFMLIKKNTVFFTSFLGQYNDNPKYISEKLHQLDPTINIVWSTSSRGHEMAPDYSDKVEYNSKKYFDYIYRAEVVVTNGTGENSLGFTNYKNKLIERLINRRNQLCVSTWHGTPLKKIGADILKKKYKYYLTCCDWCVAGCKHTANILEKTYMLNGKIKMYGTPRNDILFNPNTNINMLKRKLKLPLNKKIILFAPTFRDSLELSGISQFKTFNIPKILSALKEKFKEDFVFVIRVHNNVLEQINNENLIGNMSNIVYNGNHGDDMAEYLVCTDILLTDYSSSFFDFALTQKPCFLFAPDLENYANSERGLYMDYYSLPFPVSKTNDELIKSINEFSYESYKNKVSEFNTLLGNIEDGNASERIANEIIKFIHK